MSICCVANVSAVRINLFFSIMILQIKKHPQSACVLWQTVDVFCNVMPFYNFSMASILRVNSLTFISSISYLLSFVSFFSML